ncbi:MAG: hypothetical protein CMP59_04550 [Flavobacteriales bacterium]|nr:hypothetical protein [Flavobacteriales bacterium]
MLFVDWFPLRDGPSKARAILLKSEIGNQKSEIRNRKFCGALLLFVDWFPLLGWPEQSEGNPFKIGNRKSEIRNRKSEILKRSVAFC